MLRSSTSASYLSDEHEFTTIEKVCQILRTSHLQRGNITCRTLRDRSSLASVTGNMHVMVRVLSFLEGYDIMKTFRVSKKWLVYQYCNVLWKLVYVCQSPLKYSTRMQEVGHLLVSPLDGSGFDVHELEERERYFDLFVVLSVCGFYRVLRNSERATVWPATVADATASFACCVGHEIATSLKGIYGSFSEALPAVWSRLFYSPVPRESVNQHSVTGPLCSEKSCCTVHYRGPLLAALFTGVSDYLGFKNRFTVSVNGCCMTLAWEEVIPEPMREREQQKFVMRPNVMFFTKSVNLLSILVEQNGAGTVDLGVFVKGMLSGGDCGLRRTPAEMKRVSCRHCKEEVSSYDYASQHSNGRCLRAHTESSSLPRTSSFDSMSFLTSNNSTPITPAVPTPRAMMSVEQASMSISSAAPPLPLPLAASSAYINHTQQELETQLRERRLRFFASLLPSVS